MGMGISQYVIVIVSLTIFLIPVSQVDAIFFFSPEIGDEEFFKNFREIHELDMEKFPNANKSHSHQDFAL